jgi:3-isopropylmalate/(R)-2-methylmalate dehydratase small subunit
MSLVSGRIVRLADNVNTDVILPGPYLNITDPDQLGEHLLETYDRELAAAIEPGDVLLGGCNFGSGSSREQAPLAILARGIEVVVAASFARIFLRNAINLGLAAVQSAEAWQGLAHGDRVELDLEGGVIQGPRGQRFAASTQPPFLAEILDAGGIIEWTRRRLTADA